MINLKIPKEDKELFNYERQYHPHPRVRQRMEVLWLKSQKLPHKEICRLVDITSSTVTTYLKLYQEKGIEALLKVNFNQPKSEMNAYRSLLIKYFKENPPASVKQAMADIEKLTGIKRSENRIRIFLNSLGLKRRKMGMIPAKADFDKQEAFKKKNLNLG